MQMKNKTKLWERNVIRKDAGNAIRLLVYTGFIQFEVDFFSIWGLIIFTKEKYIHNTE